MEPTVLVVFSPFDIKHKDPVIIPFSPSVKTVRENNGAIPPVVSSTVKDITFEAFVLPLAAQGDNVSPQRLRPSPFAVTFLSNLLPLKTYLTFVGEVVVHTSPSLQAGNAYFAFNFLAMPCVSPRRPDFQTCFQQPAPVKEVSPWPKGTFYTRDNSFFGFFLHASILFLA